MRLIDLLNKKDSKYRIPIYIGLNDTIYQAIQKLIEHDRGSLPVCNNEGELEGIITERDIVRKYFSQSGQSIRIQVKNIMSTDVVVGYPEDDLNYALEVMKKKRIRHLPIIDERNKVIGMVSMRDLLGIQLEESDSQIRYLSDYIQGSSQS